MQNKFIQWFQNFRVSCRKDARIMGYRLKMGLFWLSLAAVTGVAVGLAGSAFAWGIHIVTGIRMAHRWLILLLPFGGLALVFCYRAGGMKKDRGTNLLFSTVQHEEEDVPARVAPLIFAASMITHLFGGSAGREGAALQMGGSLGNTIGNLLHLKENDKKIVVMSGMSAAFSAVFGTPLAASVFSMEMINVGEMQYAALVPCVFASLIAGQIAIRTGLEPESYHLTHIPQAAPENCLKILLLAALCAALSILFCRMLRLAGSLYNHYITNPYARIAVGGVLVILLTMAVGSFDYNGSGADLIERAVRGEAPAAAFLLKMIFTSVTLAAGYKGGEIVPAFCVGATFGCLFGQILHLSPSLCAGVGMIAVFCGVTNCPITSMLIGFELFGFEGVVYLLMGVSVSYMLSGTVSLYREQVVMYSKYHLSHVRSAEEHENFEGADYED